MFTCVWAKKPVLQFLQILTEFFKSTAEVLEDSARMHLLYRDLFNTSEWFQDRLWVYCKCEHHDCTHIKVQMTVCPSLSLMTGFVLANVGHFVPSRFPPCQVHRQPFSQASSVAICILLQSPDFSCESINPVYQLQGRTVYSPLQN